MATAEENSTATPLYTKEETTIIIMAACLGWGMEYFDLQLLSLYAPAIMDTFKVSKATFGAIASLQLLATAIGGVVFGLLADKYGRKRMLTWTVMVFSVSTFLIAFAQNIESVFVLRFITGFGVGGEWAIGFSLLNEAWNPKRRGIMGGIVQSSIWPAYALAVLVNQLVTDWHIGFAIGLLPAAAAIWIRIKCPESKVWLQYNELKLSGKLPQELQAQAKQATLLQIFNKDVIRYTICGTIIVAGGQYAFYAMAQWIPTLLTETLKAATSVKSNVLYLGSVVSFAAYIIAGALSDYFGRKKAFALFSCITLIAYTSFSVVSMGTPNLTNIVICYMLFSLGVGYFGIFGVWFSELFPTRIRATGSSFAYSVGRGIASGAPLIAGMVATTSNLAVGMSTGVIAIIIMLVVIPFMRENKGRDISSVE